MGNNINGWCAAADEGNCDTNAGTANHANRPQSASLEEERREILTSVMGVLDGNSPDPDEMAACSYLLKHLTQYRRPVRPTARRVRYDG